EKSRGVLRYRATISSNIAKPRLKPISVSTATIGIGTIIIPIAKSSINATIKSGCAGARAMKLRRAFVIGRFLGRENCAATQRNEALETRARIIHATGPPQGVAAQQRQVKARRRLVIECVQSIQDRQCFVAEVLRDESIDENAQ